MNGAPTTARARREARHTTWTSTGIMYLTKAGNLSAENERQPVLPGIRAVGPARKLDEDRAPAKEA